MFEFDAEMNVVINGAFVHENMSMILSVLSPSLSLFFFMAGSNTTGHAALFKNTKMFFVCIFLID